MTDLLAQTLGSILESAPQAFDANGLTTYEVSDDHVVHLRWSEDAGTLLAAIPLGQLNKTHRNIRAFMLLTANHDAYITGGGAFGWDQESNEIYISRSFVMPEENYAEALLGFKAFCFSAEVAQAWLNGVNAVEFNPEDGAPSLGGVGSEDLEVIAGQYVEAAVAEAGAEVDTTTAAACVAFASSALSNLGIEQNEFDDDFVCELEGSDGQAAAIRFDPVLNEIVLTAHLGEADDERLLTVAGELLAANAFVGETGNCVLGVLDDEPCQLTFSSAVALEALQPNHGNLANFIASFLNQAEAWQTRLQELLTDAPAEPEPPVFANFV